MEDESDQAWSGRSIHFHSKFGAALEGTEKVSQQGMFDRLPFEVAGTPYADFALRLFTQCIVVHVWNGLNSVLEYGRRHPHSPKRLLQASRQGLHLVQLSQAVSVESAGTRGHTKNARTILKRATQARIRECALVEFCNQHCFMSVRVDRP